MGDVTIGQFVSANVILVVIVLVTAAASAALLWRTRRSRMRRLPVTLGGVRVEYQRLHLDEDLVVECNWRMTFLLANATKMPSLMPVFSERAVIRAARREYIGRVYLERSAVELNPSEAAAVWVVCQLPVGTVPERVELACLRAGKVPLVLRQRDLLSAHGATFSQGI